jgi:hypothetical protein
MRLEDLSPKQAALLDTATDGRFYAVLRELLAHDEVRDVHVLVVHQPPTFAVLVMGVCGERLVFERELPVAAEMPERVKLGLLIAWTDQILAAHGAWVRRMAPKLVAVGMPPMLVPGSRSS